MVIDDYTLRQLLYENQLYTKGELDKAAELAKQLNIPLYDAILQLEDITDDQLGRLIADFLDLPFVNLSRIVISDEILNIIPEVVAREQNIIAFSKDSKGVHLAMANPTNLEIREFIKRKSGEKVIPYMATNNNIEESLALYHKELKKEFKHLIREQTEEAKGAEAASPPIKKIADMIISYANDNKASDIHISPRDTAAKVRYRIDGVLHEVAEIPNNIHEKVVARIKIMAKLRIDEHQSAQDGKIQWTEEQLIIDNLQSTNENLSNIKNQTSIVAKLDIRVSIVPVTAGEKIVMRLLSEKSRKFSLASLGIKSKDLINIRNEIKKPYGMILSTGPTGSGKTTTMYAVLKILNKPEINIMTIEDPVEFDIEGIDQIQVNPKTNLTFAEGLRSIVRQDPDTILVGEIRDDETAKIAVNSATTGHLVLSTLHANNAATTFIRLADLKIEPYLIASTINIIIAQRLIRKICNKCMVSTNISTNNSAIGSKMFNKYFGSSKTARAYKGKGCDVCHNTGFTGRTGLFETLIVSKKIQEAIIRKADSMEIQSIAVKEGMSTLLEDGLRKVKQGTTTLEEVLGATKE